MAKKGKIGITGMSFGGYCCWFQIANASNRDISAAVPVSGMTDFIIDYKSTQNYMKQLIEEMMGGKPNRKKRVYIERSPIHHFKNINANLLIVHGAQDTNVSLKQINASLRKLKKCGIPYEILIFNDEGHGISKKKNRKIMLKHIADFFDKCL